LNNNYIGSSQFCKGLPGIIKYKKIKKIKNK